MRSLPELEASRAGNSHSWNPPGPTSAGSSVSVVCSGTAAFTALRPRAAWLEQRIQMGPQRRLRRSTSGPQAGAGSAEGGAHGARRQAPAGPEEVSSAAGRAQLRGVPARASRPSPPARLRPASPCRGLCPPAAPRPLPVAAGSSPPPPRRPHFLGAGGGSGAATRGLSRGSSRRGGIRSRAESGAKAALAKKMSA